MCEEEEGGGGGAGFCNSYSAEQLSSFNDSDEDKWEQP